MRRWGLEGLEGLEELEELEELAELAELAAGPELAVRGINNFWRGLAGAQ